MANKPTLISRTFDVPLNGHKHEKALNVQQVHTALYILKGSDNFTGLTQEQILNKYRCTRLPSKSELWGVEKLSNYLGLTINNTVAIIWDTVSMEDMLKDAVYSRMLKVERLVAKFNIETKY